MSLGSRDHSPLVCPVAGVREGEFRGQESGKTGGKTQRRVLCEETPAMLRDRFYLGAGIPGQEMSNGVAELIEFAVGRGFNHATPC